MKRIIEFYDRRKNKFILIYSVIAERIKTVEKREVGDSKPGSAAGNYNSKEFEEGQKTVRCKTYRRNEIGICYE